MKIYKLLIEYSKYLKENNSEVSLLLNLYDKLKILVQDPVYIDYFQLCKNYYYYYFYSPVVAYDVLNKIYSSNDFDRIITKEKCEKILKNEDIIKFVNQSKIINTIFIEKASEIFLQNHKGSSTENYFCNSIINEFGNSNIIFPISIINSNSKYVSKYADNRKKIQKDGIFTYPYLITKKFINEQLLDNIDLPIINAFECINLIYSLIIKIFYDVIFDRVLYLKNKDIKIIIDKSKNDFKVLEFESENFILFIHELETIIIDENVYFPCAYTKNLIQENKTIYKCYTLNINNNTFSDFDILNSIELMSILKKDD